ncbi:MAG TPA: hypothetical protein VED47_02055 [Burkholderiaceae bacterium]|nr:hypothetical protein [Burkholderiaceae bacterium]
MRSKAVLLLALLGLVGAARCLGAEGCLHYEPDEVDLQGTLQLKAFAGPPHYKSVELGDQPEAVWILTLPRPICIAPLPDDDWNVARDGVQTIEVVARTAFTVDLNGALVNIRGTLTRARGAHRHAEITLRASKVAAK